MAFVVSFNKEQLIKETFEITGKTVSKDDIVCVQGKILMIDDQYYMYDDHKVRLEIFPNVSGRDSDMNSTKMLPVSRWYIDDVHVATLFVDYNCDETVLVTNDEIHYDLEYDEILNEVSNFIKHFSDSDFYTYHISANTQTTLLDIKKQWLLDF